MWPLAGTGVAADPVVFGGVFAMIQTGGYFPPGPCREQTSHCRFFQKPVAWRSFSGGRVLARHSGRWHLDQSGYRLCCADAGSPRHRHRHCSAGAFRTAALQRVSCRCVVANAAAYPDHGLDFFGVDGGSHCAVSSGWGEVMTFRDRLPGPRAVSGWCQRLPARDEWVLRPCALGGQTPRAQFSTTKPG